MGQPVRVIEKTSVAFPGTVRYETNRPLSGMGHRNYDGPESAISELDPADMIAKRLFERGGVEHVHVNGSTITVDLERGATADGISELIEQLFLHYT